MSNGKQMYLERWCTLNTFFYFLLQVFKDFNPVPLASASLAQVHLAHTFDGKKVAVKV